MSDRFEEIFARTRPAAVQLIRPPGADVARTVVRRRRRRRNTTIAVAAVLAVLGGILIRPGSSHAPVQPVSPEQLQEQARNSLGPANGPIAVEETGEMQKGWKKSGRPLLGEQALSVVCAGTGSMTFAVLGIPGQESPSQEPVEIRRFDVPCSASPGLSETRYLTGMGLESVEFTVVEAAGTAGFAFRVLTPDTGAPMDIADNQANTTGALHLTEEESNSQFGLGAQAPPGGEYSDTLPAWIGGRFAVAAACAGVGKLRITIKRAGGKTVDTWELPCSWPPKRYDWNPARGSGTLQLHVAFEPSSDSLDDADFSIQFAPK